MTEEQTVKGKTITQIQFNKKYKSKYQSFFIFLLDC